MSNKEFPGTESSDELLKLVNDDVLPISRNTEGLLRYLDSKFPKIGSNRPRDRARARHRRTKGYL